MCCVRIQRFVTAPVSAVSRPGHIIMQRIFLMKLDESALELLTSFDEETFVDFLIDSLYVPGDDGHPVLGDLHLLYEPKVLYRLGGIVDNPLLWDAKLVPALRQCPGLWVPDYKGKVLAAQAACASELDYTALDTVTQKDVDWLWWPYLAKGTLAMLDGDPSTGKSMLTLALASTLSQGGAFPDQQGQMTAHVAAAHTLLLANEDSLAATALPRLKATGAYLSRIIAFHGAKAGMAKKTPFTIDNIPLLVRAMDTWHPALVIIDPIQAYLGPKVDMHRANETRPLLAALAAVADEYACCILCVRHPAKAPGMGGGKAMMRGLGSVDFIGAARTGLFVESDSLFPEHSLVSQTKNNFGVLGRTQCYSRAEGCFAWAGITRLTAEILAGTGRGHEPVAFFAACRWLERRLDGGIPVPMKDLEDQAEQEIGVSTKILRKARIALGAKTRQTPHGWEWQLPTLTIIHPPGAPVLSGTTVSTGISDDKMSSSESIAYKEKNIFMGYSGYTETSGSIGYSRTSDVVSDVSGHNTADTSYASYTPFTPDYPEDLVLYARVRDTQIVPEPVDNSIGDEKNMLCALCRNRMQMSVTPPRCIACGWRPSV